ncbi:MAG: helix-hairpin-helix domain-containing protein [Planctomycetaceae bacterium]|nr:helix-hairpin-helix domain-containing protein [Planctomycetaceae bacterium]
MISRITGTLVSLTDVCAFVQVGGLEYEVLVPDMVRRQLQSRIGEDVSLRTLEYLEGNPQKGRLTPRIIGFANEAEREFFELVCSVDGVGAKKALRAMVRPVREFATSIEEQDIKQLSTLPGIGAAVAERIVAKLRRKMAKFALMVSADLPADQAADVFTDAYDALISVGHSSQDAMARIETVKETGRKFKTVEDVLAQIYQSTRQ